MKFGLGLTLDRNLSSFQVTKMLGLSLQMNQQNSSVDFYPFWGMPRRHYRNLALLDLSSYPKRMKRSRHYLNCQLMSLPNYLRWVRRLWVQIWQD